MERIILADYDDKCIKKDFKSEFEAKRWFANVYGIRWDAWECEYIPYYGDKYAANHEGKTAHFAVVF